MNKIVIYQKEKSNLGSISFLNDLPNQIKIKDIDSNSDLFFVEISNLFTKINSFLGIKESISRLNGHDIIELLLIKFKMLTLNEIDYAFKLERYGEFGKKIEHFQLFNAQYVSEVLNRYLEWKRKEIKIYLPKKNYEEILSLEEIKKKENDCVLRFLNEFEYTMKIKDDDFIFYRHFERLGLIHIPIERKKEIKKEAINILYEQEINKKALSISENKQKKSALKNIENGTGGLVINKCQTLALQEFLIELYKCKEEVIIFKNNFK